MFKTYIDACIELCNIIGDFDVDANLFENVSDGLIEGFIAEFGVASGTTIRELARVNPTRRIWGFDSFEGLPEDWNNSHKKGYFRQTTLPDVPENVTLVKGLFSESLPEVSSTFHYYNENAALIHFDADLYSSTMDAIRFMFPYMVEGTVLIFDELYYDYDDNWREHEYRALLELEEKLRYRNLTLQFLARRHKESYAFVVIPV